MSMDVASRLAEVSSMPNTSPAKLEKLVALTHDVCASQSAAAIDELINTMIDSADANHQFPKAVLNKFADECTVEAYDPEVMKAASLNAINKLQPRIVSFEEEVTKIRVNLSLLYEYEESFAEAARTLGGIPFDAKNALMTKTYVLDKYIRIAMLYLQVDDSVSAEQFINRASMLVGSPEIDATTKQTYKACYARILDSKRRFLDAAGRYYDLSQSVSGMDMTEQATSDMMHALGEAITCAILSPAGPQRSRLIGTLIKDERSSACTFFGILERMHNMRIVKQAQVEQFQKSLKAHQMATDREGTTVLAKAIIEHNMLSASRLYDNISLPELGMLLDVDKAMAEKYAAAMIEEGRMLGSIDQVDEFIQFADVTESATFSHWDTQVEALCIAVNTVVESVSAKHPQFAAGL